MWDKMKLAVQIRIAQKKERERERERENVAPKSHFLTSGLLWLTLNLALIIECLS
jgi:hypothetical protein